MSGRNEVIDKMIDKLNEMRAANTFKPEKNVDVISDGYGRGSAGSGDAEDYGFGSGEGSGQADGQSFDGHGYGPNRYDPDHDMMNRSELFGYAIEDTYGCGNIKTLDGYGYGEAKGDWTDYYTEEPFRDPNSLVKG